LIAAFPRSLDQQLEWRNVMDSLLGPVASESMRAVAREPGAFFGSRFGDDGLLGPLTASYLLKAADLGFERAFSRAGAVEIYKATLAFAAARPDLFLGTPAESSDKLLAAVFRDLAAAVEQHSPPFDAELLARLGAATLEAAGLAVGERLTGDGPWHDVLSRMLTPVVAAAARALRTGDKGALRLLSTRENLESFVRIVVTQIAATPGMIISRDNAEVSALVAAIATQLPRLSRPAQLAQRALQRPATNPSRCKRQLVSPSAQMRAVAARRAHRCSSPQ
jgi:hypothetical protein